MAYCSRCGFKLPDGSKFCPGCGAPVAEKITAEKQYPQPAAGYQSFSYQNAGSDVLKKTIQKIDACGTLWLVIGILQIILGGLTIYLFSFGLFTLLLGIWNIVNAMKIKKNAAYFKTNPRGIVSFYEHQKSTTVLFLVLNLLLGAVISVIAPIYELSLEEYISNNRNTLNSL